VSRLPRGQTREETEGANLQYGDLAARQERHDPAKLKDGFNTMPDGEAIFYIPNPAIGL